jgi:hypothetical protein
MVLIEFTSKNLKVNQKIRRNQSRKEIKVEIKVMINIKGINRIKLLRKSEIGHIQKENTVLLRSLRKLIKRIS